VPPYCLTVLYVYELAVYCISYARHMSPIEYLVDRFVHPLDKWHVNPIVSCENRFQVCESLPTCEQNSVSLQAPR